MNLIDHLFECVLLDTLVGRLRKMHRKWPWSGHLLITCISGPARTQYATVHRLETNKLRNVAKFFAQLFYSDALPWTSMSCIHLNEEETNSSRCVVCVCVCVFVVCVCVCVCVTDSIFTSYVCVCVCVVCVVVSL